MKIKKEYNEGDKVWIHLGDGKLYEGKIIDIFDLAHAGYPKDREFYIVQVPTEIEPLLEVRNWDDISQDAKGPIGAFRSLKEEKATQRYLSKKGIQLNTSPKAETKVETQTDNIDIGNHLEDEVYDPTPEEVNAALEKSLQARQDVYNPAIIKEKRKPYYRKKNEKRVGRTTL